MASSIQTEEGGAPESGGGSGAALLQTRAASLEASRVFDAEALRRAMNQLADRGWNKVVLPGFLDGYPIFSSSVWADYGLPRQHPRFRKWNPFEVAFDVAWRRGLDLIVSHQPYLVGSAPGRFGRLPIPRKYPKWLASRHPNRSRRSSKGAPARSYYCPVNADLRRFLCDTLHVLLEDYPFHGLQIDLRHYPFTSGGPGEYLPWCYCDACRRMTLRDLGFDPADVDFKTEGAMVRRWMEWQTEQMDKALAYIRMRVTRARRSMRLFGLLTTDSGLGKDDPLPLIHWKTWVERSLVEALVLDRYDPDPAVFASQVRQDLETLPRTSLLIPMLPRKARDGDAFLAILDQEPLSGFMTRFDDWDREDFEPSERVAFVSPAMAAESDPIGGICMLFDNMAQALPMETEFIAFLGDLSRILTRPDMPLSAERLVMIAQNIEGLYKQVAEGQMDFGHEQDRVLHDLDLAVRLTYLAGGDVVE